jgi:hypothetical protein
MSLTARPLYPNERASATRRIGRVDPGAGLDILRTGKSFAPLASKLWIIQPIA